MDTKALRQKILDLAVRGKLVPQNPDDEPARILLERIGAEKKQMVKDGRLKAKDIKNDSVIYFKEDNLPYEQFADGTEKCITDEIPFELPDGWEWCNLSMIGQTNIGLTYSPKDIAVNGTMVLRSSNIINGKLDFTDLVRVNTSIRDNQYVKENDILICARNGSKALVGKCAIIRDIKEKASFGAFMAIYRTPFYEYVYWFLNSNYFREIFYDSNSTAINQLTQAMIKSARIPLPPLSEQKRIADKINELMGLVDVIEQNKTDLQTAVKLAKEKILDLAIRGQLVPQNPDDEPASVLLERIRAEKQQLIQQGKIKPDKKDTVTFTDDELPFELPDGWEWARLQNISEIVTGSTPSKKKLEFYGGDFPFYKPTDLEQGENVVYASEYLSDLGKSVSRLIPKGSTAVCCIGSIGKSGYIGKEGTTNQQINSIIPMIENKYVYYYSCSKFFVDELLSTASATTIAIVNKGKMSNILIPIPPLHEQKRIADKINQLFSMLDSITEFLN